MDKRTFVTDHERALQSLFGENSDSSPQFRGDISSIAARLATVFASLKVGSAPADVNAFVLPGRHRAALQGDLHKSLNICEVCAAPSGTSDARTCLWPDGHNASCAVPQPVIEKRTPENSTLASGEQQCQQVTYLPSSWDQSDQPLFLAWLLQSRSSLTGMLCSSDSWSENGMAKPPDNAWSGNL